MIKGIPTKSKIGAVQALKISPFKEIIKPTVPHKHADYFELIILNQGAGYHTIDDTTYEVLPPSVYFLKPGQTHCWDFSRIPKGYVILFREELMNRDGLEIIYNLPTYIQLTESDALFDLVSGFCRDYQASTPTAILKAYLQLILLKISAHANARLAKQVTFHPVYYKFKSLVNENYQQLKKVQEYADLLKTTVTLLTSICKAASGKTPSMLVNERVLLEAKTLLSSTELSIKEIAVNLEFSDSSHFVKFFKLNTNLTPGNYRELAVKSKIIIP
jgi:AraC family transcriptional activator of pobA